MFLVVLEATAGIEPAMELLQSSELPLFYVATTQCYTFFVISSNLWRFFSPRSSATSK